MRVQVILETGELRVPDLIARAALDAFHNGADFIKTSTGKTATGATLEAARIMLQVIRDLCSGDGDKLVQRGLKVSGGVRTHEEAMAYIHLVQEILPADLDFLQPLTFRFGVSGLLTNLLKDEAAETMAPTDIAAQGSSAGDTGY